MGCGGSAPLDPEEARRDREIAQQLQESQAQDKRFLAKLLLLGPGESGKSTIFKQLIIAGRGFTDFERSQKSEIIQESTLGYLLDLIDAVEENKDLHNLSISSEGKDFVSSLKETASLSNYDMAKVMSSDFQEKLTKLWNEEAVQATWNLEAGNVQVPRCLGHFMKKQSEVYSEGYTATDEDLLLLRARTLGIIEEQFEVNDEKIILVDVGGQRSERRKWINCFDSVTSVLFVAGVGDYDMNVWEDQTTNRIHEALKLLSELTKNKVFENTPFILFLNKSDILQEKVERGVPLTLCFPEYTGNQTFDAVKEYMAQKFLECRESGPRMYVHFTCATDTMQVKKLFGSIVEVIINKVLVDTGLV